MYNSRLEGRRRILVIDDDKDILLTFRTCMERLGWEIDLYDDPVKALSDFKPGYYDRVLTDIRMPKLNGFELVDRLKALQKSLEVCFITAFEGYYLALKDIYPRLDAKCFIRKPIGCEDLVNHLLLHHKM
jgi:DNA-binding NtrC family response regulator